MNDATIWRDLIARCQPRFDNDSNAYFAAVKVAADAVPSLIAEARKAVSSTREFMPLVMSEAIKIRDAYRRDQMTDWEWFIANG